MTSTELTRAQGGQNHLQGGEMPLNEPKKIPVLHFTV